MPYQRLQAGDRTGEYLLEEKVAQGPDTEVWKAKHHVLASPAAVKVAYSERGVAALQAAGVAQHTLRHPRVVRILGLNLEHDPPFLVTEFGEGGSLRGLLLREPRLSWDRFSGIFRDILDGLDAVHRGGRVHGNLKPENVLLDADGRALLTDFGTPSPVEPDDALLSGVLAGGERATAIIDPYIAPERREGSVTDARGDVWSAGLILFEALTGKRPEGSEGPADLVHDLPSPVERAFRRAYTRPEKRYAAAGEMAAELFGTPAETASRSKPAPEEAIRIVAASAACACGYTNRVEYHFCVKCGARLGSPPRKRDPTKCASCGKPRRGGYRFCPFCGARHGNP
ncbi:MAG: serine/threonine-protein kinase [Planctomycetota bacterium]|jgi:serine/threonine protein kinase